MGGAPPDDVLSEIERAWAGIEPPASDNLAGRDSCVGEYGYVAVFFRDRTWQDVDLRSLREEYPGPHDACLSFMSAEAFLYFLPAYMAPRAPPARRWSGSGRGGTVAWRPSRRTSAAIVGFLEWRAAGSEDPLAAEALGYWQARRS